MSLMNRLGNCHNQYQGSAKKVLCVCSAGLLRSPTAAWVLSNEPYNYNTRAVGMTEDFALIHIDEVHVEWADEIVVMNPYQKDYIDNKFKTDKKIIVLNIPDKYPYRHPELVELIKTKYTEIENT